MAFWSSRLV